MTKLILASSSKYRRQLLANIGIDVELVPPNIDETQKPNESPVALSQRLASEKAYKVAKRHPQRIVIGSDQVAMVETPNGQEVLGKPGSIENAVNQLMLCQGKLVSFYSALSLCQINPHGTPTTISVTNVEETHVHFRIHSEQQLRAYVEKEMPLDCAGSFKSEGLGVLLFERINSRDPNTLIGLPIMLLQNMLDKHFNIDLLTLATVTN